jgi:hypothetical protein
MAGDVLVQVMLKASREFYAFFEAYVDQADGFVRQEKTFVFAEPDHQMPLQFLQSGYEGLQTRMCPD